MDVKIEESWKALLQEEFDKPYFAELIAFVKNEYAQTRIFPPGKLIFNAFNHCTVDNTKVVILGHSSSNEIKPFTTLHECPSGTSYFLSAITGKDLL